VGERESCWEGAGENELALVACHLPLGGVTLDMGVHPVHRVAVLSLMLVYAKSMEPLHECGWVDPP